MYIANVVKCRPPGNRDPQPSEIASCRPFLDTQLDLIAPRVVVPLGNFATKLLLDTKVGITKLRGQQFPFRETAVLIPVLHPSAVLRNGGAALAQARADFVVIRRATRGRLMELRTGSAAMTRAVGAALASAVGALATS